MISSSEVQSEQDSWRRRLWEWIWSIIQKVSSQLWNVSSPNVRRFTLNSLIQKHQPSQTSILSSSLLFLSSLSPLALLSFLSFFSSSSLLFYLLFLSSLSHLPLLFFSSFPLLFLSFLPLLSSSPLLLFSSSSFSLSPLPLLFSSLLPLLYFSSPPLFSSSPPLFSSSPLIVFSSSPLPLLLSSSTLKNRILLCVSLRWRLQIVPSLFLSCNSQTLHCSVRKLQACLRETEILESETVRPEESPSHVEEQQTIKL